MDIEVTYHIADPGIKFWLRLKRFLLDRSIIAFLNIDFGDQRQDERMFEFDVNLLVLYTIDVHCQI